MTAHRLWLELAASEPAFPLAATDRASLDDHLAGCAACVAATAELEADARRIGAFTLAAPARLRGHVVHGALVRQRRGGALQLALLLGLLVVATLGISAGLTLMSGGERGLPQQLLGGPKAVDWSTDRVRLRADSMLIEASGQRFVTAGELAISSDPGSLDSWTLELTWHEHAVEQRLQLYFAADQTHWWIGEVRTYDGVPGMGGEWAVFPSGPYARTRLGVPWTGDLDLTGEGRRGPVRLQLRGVELSVTPETNFVGGGRTFAQGAAPFAVGGPLHCSGILQLKPREAHDRLLALGYRISWRWVDDAYSDIRLEPPDGVIVETAIGTHGEIVLFVFAPDDPVAVVPPVPDDCP